MQFPKQVMTITELCEMGFTRHDLNKYAHMKPSPAHLSPGGGVYRFDTEKLKMLIEKKSNQTR